MNKEKQLELAISYNLKAHKPHMGEASDKIERNKKNIKQTLQKKFKENYIDFCHTERTKGLENAFDSACATTLTALLSCSGVITGYEYVQTPATIMYLSCLGALITAGIGTNIVKHISYANKMKPTETDYQRE